MSTGIRQQPGLACEECRRRKARCDRKRPRCATCADSGISCIVVDKRSQRGPKRGQLKALRNRVAMLERQLSAQMEIPQPELAALQHMETAGQASLYEVEPQIEPVTHDLLDLTNLASLSTSSYIDLGSSTNSPLHECSISSAADTPAREQSQLPSPMPLTGPLDLFDMVRADLDQVYFDRVHAVVPIIHKRRYYSWAGQEHPEPARHCLRLAMQTIASSVSPTFCNLSEALYNQTRRILNALDVLPPEVTQLEHIQASLLVAHYECVRVHEHRAMLTAGRAFTMVHLTRLYDVDGAGPSETHDNFAETEERRRTFWLAFALDRFLCMRNESTLTLNEDMMLYPRLPAPETNFQNSQPIEMDFLPEAVANSGRSRFSPFVECIIVASLHWRCVAQRRLAQAANVLATDSSRDIGRRIEWLAVMLEKRMQTLMPPSSSGFALVERDPMLAFASMLAHSAMIHLYYTAQLGGMQGYEERALRAARSTARLSKVMPQLFHFEVHPFSPSALSTAASFLQSHGRICDLDKGHGEVNQLLDALRSLSHVNRVAREHLRNLGSACKGSEDGGDHVRGLHEAPVQKSWWCHQFSASSSE
ncbi:hypothetical protein DL771_006347 [Monosporascus sp. 5C6A]|nr:hypothetical protein DL771_006347 [Monosporascus sp. 5C6A]